MPERKSWDVQPRRSAAAPQHPPAKPQERPARAAKRKKARRLRPVRQTRTPHSRARRAPSKDTQGIVLGLFLAALLIGGIYVAWMPRFRVQAVAASGPEQDGVAQAASNTLRGTYLFLLPHDSIFFYSPSKMRKAVLDAYPDIDAVSIHRSSFHSVSVLSIARASAFMWCGASIDTPYADGSCYDTDVSGLVFAPASDQERQASSTLRVFGVLDVGAVGSSSPVRAHVVGAAAIPNALRFVKAMRALGAPVSALALRDDEADLWLQGPTRITYLLGHEDQAAQLAVSAFPALNLTDHSIQYVDLRFEGKVYVKKAGQ